jgi:hypothetical protein
MLHPLAIGQEIIQRLIRAASSTTDGNSSGSIANNGMVIDLPNESIIRNGSIMRDSSI